MQKSPKNKTDYYFSSELSFPNTEKTVKKDMYMPATQVNHVFEKMTGLGPVNIGTEKWQIAKIKQARINKYLNDL